MSDPFSGYHTMLANIAQRHGVPVTVSNTVPLHDPAFGAAPGHTPEVAIALHSSGGGTVVFYDNSAVPAERTVVLAPGEALIGAVTYVRVGTTATGLTAMFMGTRP